MTDIQFNKQRFKIVKDYLKTGEILVLPSLGINLGSSTPGIYHVFCEGFEYSITDSKLKELAARLTLDEIKRIYVDTRIITYEDKLIQRNYVEFNPLDFENMH